MELITEVLSELEEVLGLGVAVACEGGRVAYGGKMGFMVMGHVKLIGVRRRRYVSL